eukprot:357778-Chlamydomonas_euryale.AAC.1
MRLQCTLHCLAPPQGALVVWDLHVHTGEVEVGLHTAHVGAYTAYSEYTGEVDSLGCLVWLPDLCMSIYPFIHPFRKQTNSKTG